MKRATKILETYGKLEEKPVSQSVRINEKVDITPEQAKDIKAAFQKSGFNVEINSSTNGHMYIEGLYQCGGRYVNIEFDRGGFRISVSNQGNQYANLLSHSEAVKLGKELKTCTDLLEKIKNIDPELV